MEIGAVKLNISAKTDFYQNETAGNGNPVIDILNAKGMLFADNNLFKTEYDLINYDTAEKAMLNIISDFAERNGAAPEIIAFGEIHPPKNYPKNMKTTADYFAEEIIPVMAKKGYKDLVVEFLFARGASGDKIVYNLIQKEISELKDRVDFNANNFSEEYPLLKRILSRSNDPKGLLKIILAAKKHGIKIHGGGVTCTQFVDILDNKIPEEKSTEFINKNSYAALSALLNKSRKTMCYHGAAHNDIMPARPELSFMDEVTKKFGLNKCMEVDLIVPGVLKSREEDNRYSHYLQAAPSKGVSRFFISKENLEVITFGK